MIRLMATAVLCCLAISPAAGRSKIPVLSSDDLPRHTYTIAGRASDLLDDRAAFDTLAREVRRDIEEEQAAPTGGDAGTPPGRRPFVDRHREEEREADEQREGVPPLPVEAGGVPLVQLEHPRRPRRSRIGLPRRRGTRPETPSA